MNTVPLISRYDDIYFLNSNTGFLISGLGDLRKTTDGANSWTHIYDSPNIVFRSVGFFDENVGIIGTLTDSSALLRTTNGGADFQKVSIFDGTPAPKGICGINIVNSTTAYAVGRYYPPAYCVKTTNKGANWAAITLDTSLVRNLVDCYFWSADSGIVAGGYGTTSNINAVVLFTSNGGASFTRVYRSSRTYEFCWKISFPSKNIGYIAVYNPSRAVILKTTNRGMNWIEFLPPGFDDLEGIGFANDNTGWVGPANSPAYKTTDGGLTWAADTWGYNLNRIRFLNDTLGYASGNIVYKYTTKTIGITQISAEVPDKFSLEQNYPNPFNPSTTIRWTVPVSGFVSIKVYNSLGNEIEAPVNERQNAGSYSVDFNAASLPSGVYFYKLQTEKFSETKKMLLIK